MKKTIVILFGLCLFAVVQAAEPLDLSGQWRFQLD